MKKNLILLVVLIIIGVFFYVDREREKKEEERQEKEKQLFTLEKDEVKEVTIVKGDKTFKAMQTGDRWKLVQPFETNGDKSNWDGLVNSYTSGKHQRVVVENAEDLKPFGLDNPSIQVSLAGVDGATKTTLLLGNETPTSGKYFAMIQGSSDVLTVYSTLHSQADKDLYDWRDKTIVEMETDDVQKIEIAHAATHMTLQRRGEDEWLATDPLQARVDEGKVRDMINGVKNGKIKQFIDEKPDALEPYGLIHPATQLVFWTGEKENQASWASRALLIGSTSATGDCYAKREGQVNVFTVGPTDFNDVPKTLDEIRKKKLTTLKSWEIDYVELSSGGSVVVEATKSSGDWTLLQPQEGKANYTSVSNFVRAITDLEATSFIQGTTEEFGLDQPVLIIQLKKTDTGQEETIELAKGKAGDSYIGARTDPLEIYTVQLDTVTGLLDKAKEVKLEAVPTPTPVPADSIQDSTSDTKEPEN